MITEEEAEGIKKKIIEHIKATFPPDKAGSAIEQISSMDSSQLEKFLEKNKIIERHGSEDDEKSKCVFCAISEGKINSIKLDENDNAVAVLEINPISRGHVIVIPKIHSTNAGKEALAMAKKISKRIEEKFSPKKVEISKSVMFGHEILNILPVYENEDFNSERGHATIDELEIVRHELEKKEEKIEKLKIERLKDFLWLPKRIP